MSGRGQAIDVQVRLIIGGFLAACTLLVLFVRMTLQQPSFLTLAVAATPFFVFAALLGALFALWGGHYKTAAVNAVAMALCAGTQVPMFVADEPIRGPVVLRVATLDVRRGVADERDVLRIVRERAVDVLALQELTAEEASELTKLGLQKDLPYRYVFSAPSFPGAGLWSRWPLSQGRALPGYAATSILAEVEVPQVGKVTVSSLHPAPPGQNSPGASVVDHRRLYADVASLSGTVVLAGNLGATVDQAPLRRLMRTGFEDAAEQSGSGPAFTWPHNQVLRPFFGIDHVLSRGPLQASSVSTFFVAGSDHHALLAEFSKR